MSQKHLYSLEYFESTPPIEWGDLKVNGTLQSDALETKLNGTQLTFAGEIASYIVNFHIPTYGVFNGLHYRINVLSEFSDLDLTVFDGYIDLSQMVYLSKVEPILFTAPIVEFADPVTILDQMSVITQGLLRDKGFLNNSFYYDLPVIYESKKNVAERAIIVGNFGLQVSTLLLGAIQDFLSALSDILGVSVAIGLVELGTLAINLVIQVNALTDQFLLYFDLFYPLPVYYKGIKPKEVIEQAFKYLSKDLDYDYTVDWGIIEPVLENVYIMPSQNGVNGYPVLGVPFGDGTLKKKDYGYFLMQLLEYIKTKFNTREVIDGTIIRIKTKSDPSWDDSAEFIADNVLFGLNSLSQNGTFRNKTEEVAAVWFGGYAYDQSDAHTLTNNQDNEHEVHRELITILDERTVTLRGLEEVNIPYCMAVRKEPFDNLLDLFMGISERSDEFLTELIEFFSLYADQLSDAGISFELDASPFVGTAFGDFISNRAGCFKIDDNAFDIPKVGYLINTEKGLRIPDNFKDFIGMSALYNKYYFPFSPAQENEYKGQRTEITDGTIPFNVDDYALVKFNPNTEVSDKLAKFTEIEWIPNQRQAVTTIEVIEIFDNNIKETEI